MEKLSKYHILIKEFDITGDGQLAQEIIELEKEVNRALKLKELIKKRIIKETHSQDNVKFCMRTIYDICSNCETKELLQSLVEESEK